MLDLQWRVITGPHRRSPDHHVGLGVREALRDIREYLCCTLPSADDSHGFGLEASVGQLIHCFRIKGRMNDVWMFDVKTFGDIGLASHGDDHMSGL